MDHSRQLHHNPARRSARFLFARTHCSLQAQKSEMILYYTPHFQLSKRSLFRYMETSEKCVLVRKNLEILSSLASDYSANKLQTVFCAKQSYFSYKLQDLLISFDVSCSCPYSSWTSHCDATHAANPHIYGKEVKGGGLSHKNLYNFEICFSCHVLFVSPRPMKLGYEEGNTYSRD